MRLPAAALALILALATISCTRRPAPPATPAATRVVALSPAVASIMRDVGLGALIVGRHASDEWSDPSLPVCGDQVAGIDYEKLITTRPTHVFLQLAEPPARLLDMAKSRGFIVRNFKILTLDEIRAAARQLSNWNGAPGDLPDGVTHRAPIEDRMDAAWSRHESIDPTKVGRVLLLAQLDPAGALGPGSWHDDLLRRLGATPAITTGTAYITLDAEDVLRTAPDAIIIFIPRPASAPPRSSPPTHAELRTHLGRLATLNIPAIAANRIALIDDPMCQLPSTAMIGVAEEMARVLEEWSR